MKPEAAALEIEAEWSNQVLKKEAKLAWAKRGAAIIAKYPNPMKSL